MCVCVLLSVLKKGKILPYNFRNFFLQNQAFWIMNPILKNKNLFKICTFYVFFCTLYSYVCELSCTLSSSLFCCLKRGFVWWELYYAARQLFHSIHAVIPMCLWWYRDYRITQWGLNSSQKSATLIHTVLNSKNNISFG